MIYQTIHEYQKQIFQAPEENSSNCTSRLFFKLFNLKNFQFRREKSLEILSVGFLKLFLSWKKVISLEEAAIKLTNPPEPNKIKTRIRRLYDIANVFKSIGIIKKTHLDSKTKPGFEYLGYQGLDVFLKDFYPANVVNQEIVTKKATTIITLNNIQITEAPEQENTKPSIPKISSMLDLPYSNFKKIKRTMHSPFKSLSNEIFKKSQKK